MRVRERGRVENVSNCALLIALIVAYLQGLADVSYLCTAACTTYSNKNMLLKKNSNLAVNLLTMHTAHIIQ